MIDILMLATPLVVFAFCAALCEQDRMAEETKIPVNDKSQAAE